MVKSVAHNPAAGERHQTKGQRLIGGEGAANSLITCNLTTENAVRKRERIVQRIVAMGREGCDVIITELYAAA